MVLCKVNNYTYIQVNSVYFNLSLVCPSCSPPNTKGLLQASLCSMPLPHLHPQQVHPRTTTLPTPRASWPTPSRRGGSGCSQKQGRRKDIDTHTHAARISCLKRNPTRSEIPSLVVDTYSVILKAGLSINMQTVHKAIRDQLVVFCCFCLVLCQVVIT